MTNEEWDKLTDEEQRVHTFNLFFDKFGRFDYVVYTKKFGYLRYRCYHDGAWLEGYDMEEVIYWGA